LNTLVGKGLRKRKEMTIISILITVKSLSSSEILGFGIKHGLPRQSEDGSTLFNPQLGAAFLYSLQARHFSRYHTTHSNA